MAVAAGRDARRGYQIEDHLEDLVIFAPSGRVKNIGDAVLSFAEDDERVPLEQFLDEG